MSIQNVNTVYNYIRKGTPLTGEITEVPTEVSVYIFKPGNYYKNEDEFEGTLLVQYIGTKEVYIRGFLNKKGTFTKRDYKDIVRYYKDKGMKVRYRHKKRDIIL